MVTEDNMDNGTRKELNETGINGRGETVYSVVTVDSETGQWKHVERFDSKAEALNWMKWA